MKRNIIATCFYSIIFFVFITGCHNKVKVHSTYDKKINFSNYKSYTFYGFADKTSGISETNRNIIISATNAEMLAHGYLQNETKPDLLVNVTAIVTEKLKVSNTNYYGYGGVYRPYYWGPGNDTSEVTRVKYTNGSLIIDMVDATTKQLIWQGIGNSEIDVPLQKADTFIPEAIKKILKSFPEAKTEK